LKEAADAVTASLELAFDNDALDIETLQRHVRKAAGKFVNERTRRRPMIDPVVMEA
jgi:ribonuclease J